MDTALPGRILNYVHDHCNSLGFSEGPRPKGASPGGSRVSFNQEKTACRERGGIDTGALSIWTADSCANPHGHGVELRATRNAR